MAEKDLKYYLGLNYDIIIRRVSSDGVEDYMAFTKELDRLAFYGLGDTPGEAYQSLREVIEELFPYYLEQGLDIPEPKKEE